MSNRLTKPGRNYQLLTRQSRTRRELGLTMKCFTMSILLVTVVLPACAEERYESFDQDPGWHGHQNRLQSLSPRRVRQDFGYSPTRNAGGRSTGELGGFVQPAAAPAYYAKKLSVKTLGDKLTASGVLNCSGPQFHVVLGFFNDQTLNEWRTPNTISLRLYGRGDVFYAYLEYATARWRAGGDSPQPFPALRDPKTGRREPKGFASNRSHRWTLSYDPQANGGQGVISATIGDATAVCNLDPGHKQVGAAFNRFGLMTVMKHWDQGGEIWLDDISIGNTMESFDRDPDWTGFQNRRRYLSKNVRPRFDFGYSPTAFAGGVARGEIGGLVFRGDCRYPDKLACYADRLEGVTLDKPIQAGGKVVLRRGVSDSTTLLGFFHSKRSLSINPSQSSGIPDEFLGVAIEGPSREGFFLYPQYRFADKLQGVARGPERPVIMPDGRSHNWSLRYEPSRSGGVGRIIVSLGKQKTVLLLDAKHDSPTTVFDRFGIITTWIDGNGQQVYFDDLRYTISQGRSKRP